MENKPSKSDWPVEIFPEKDRYSSAEWWLLICFRAGLVGVVVGVSWVLKAPSNELAILASVVVTLLGFCLIACVMAGRAIIALGRSIDELIARNTAADRGKRGSDPAQPARRA